jgi:hypothetical protein
MIGITGIGAKRGTQWDRSQISVSAGPLYLFIFTSVELYSGMNNTVVENAQILNRKKCVVISQPECRRHSCMKIELVCSIFVSVPRGRIFRVSMDKGFPCAILFDIRAGSNSSTRPNISRHQLRRLDHALSHTTRLPRY